MKKIILAILILIPIAAAQTEITGFINDNAGILTEADKQQIEPILKGLYDQDLAEFAIVTVNSLDGRDIEGYAFELAEGKLGKKDKNNGLLLLVAVEDRKYRFEVGRGLEPELPDGKIGRIGRTYLVENFRAEQYGKGILEASKAIQAVLTNETESEYYVKEIQGKEVLIATAIITLIFMIIIIISIISAVKTPKKRRSDSDYFLAAWILGGMLGRGKGGGSFGGGFGGFGGGSFGGGGAGGSW